MRYGWKMETLPLQCPCGDSLSLSVNPTMICQKGDFPKLRHNEIRDLFANLFKEVCPNTCTEPECSQLQTANTDDGPRSGMSIEWHAFTPLVLSTTGGMVCECTTFYKCLADQLAEKHKSSYSLTMGWLRCRISFALLRSAFQALRRIRSSANSQVPVDIALVSMEGSIR